MFCHLPPFQAVYAAGTNVRVDLRPLLQAADGLPLHMSCIDIKLRLQVTPHATEDEPWENLLGIIDRFILRDVLSNEMVNLSGKMIYALTHAATGRRSMAVGADIAAAGAQAWHEVYLRIPFHGGVGGIAGFKEFNDAVQPVDRFRETSLQIDWAAAPLDDATLDGATAYITFGVFPFKNVIQGSDVRYSMLVHGDSQQIDFPVEGLLLHTSVISNPDWGITDYASFSIPEFSYMTGALLYQLCLRFNEGTAINATDHLNPAAPIFAPLIHIDTRHSPQGALGFAVNKCLVRSVNTNADDQHLGMVQLHDTVDLTRKLMGRGGTCYGRARGATPVYMKKNRRNAGPLVRSRLDRVLAQKLSRAA